MAESIEELSKDLECSICNELMTPPIYLCRRHHDICHVCKSKITHCTLCKSSITNLRDYSLEEESGYMIYGCKNDGCNYTCNGIDMRMHELYCTYRRYVCPIASNCNWYDLLCTLEEHVNVEHNIPVVNYDTKKLIVWRRHNLIVLSYSYDHYFMINVYNSNDDDLLLINCKLIGPSTTDVIKYIYVVKFRDCDNIDSMTFVRRCKNYDFNENYSYRDDALIVPTRMINYLKTDVFSLQIIGIH